MSLQSVLERINAAVGRAGREPEEVTLVAVGKTHSAETLKRAYELGHRDFGENRAGELAAKAAELPPDIRWHFVGSLQRNKVRLVRPVVHLLHSMDRLRLGAAWMKGPGLPPPALLEVNLAGEPQKGGVAPEQAPQLADELITVGVDLRGVMAIPPMAEDPEDSRPYFRRLSRLRDELAIVHPQIQELSMGMTDDFDVAIEEGATIIRVGRAIFGPRIQR
jgi:pyridoxal phosphate enzyme (YggS family)